MTASYLKVAFGDRIAITLVESEQVGTIDVGEATFSTIRHFFEYLGLEEHEWMPSCHATHKLGIRFENWREPGHHFYHSFERPRVVDGFNLTDWWLHNPRSDRFDRDCFLVANLSDHDRSPRHLDGSLFTGASEGVHRRSTLSEQSTQFPYAYHFDATLLADFLRDFAVQRGVRHLRDDVVAVLQDDRGWISHLRTRASGDVAGDLFVDCTGFRGLLLGRTLEEPFISYPDLPNDRSVALRVPTDTHCAQLHPYTTATAQDAGWIWTIPLLGWIGTGYVYAETYCSPDEAERTLREFVGSAAEELEANHLRTRVGRSRRSWVRNCVAIGPSSGFVEPLESTGIFFIQHGVEQLVKHFPDERWDKTLADAYNRRVEQCMEGVREFLVLHYRGAARVDTKYWRDTKTREIPAALTERLSRWRTKLPDAESIFPSYHGFEAYSYVCMLIGLGGISLRASSALSLLDSSTAQREFALLSDEASELCQLLPTDYEYLMQLAW
ncbi:tryptophan halogenase family protein [Mycobacterium montefiorense]